MHWGEFEAREPSLGALGVDKLTQHGVVLIGTVRRDGSPRISAVEPLFFDGDLSLGMGWASQKVTDLRRDPRLLVRSIVRSRDGSDGDYLVRGRAVEELEQRRQRAYSAEVAARVGWHPEVGKFHLFWVDVDDVTFIRWDDATNDQFVTRWPERREFVRRGSSATSQSPAAPYTSGLLTESPRPDA